MTTVSVLSYPGNKRGGGRPTRFLPHAKMLLIPIIFFSTGSIMLWKVLHFH